ncbi:H(+)/Cl(-) exchange transporter ClcA [Symmachiella dynata]|nr:H(+)/Cl(-) exchange transporter ClcA [Symmachiella dynata]
MPIRLSHPRIFFRTTRSVILSMEYVRRFDNLLKAFDLKSTGKWFFLSGLIGIVAGLGAIAFQFLSQLVLSLALNGVAGYMPLEPVGEYTFLPHTHTEFSPWHLLLVMAGGGLVSGWLVFKFAPEAAGHGTDGVIEAFHEKRGVIRTRVPFIKTVASAVTLGTGGSGGREGPIAQIGAGFGSYLATRLKLSDRDRRIMVAAGMGAGVGAIFRAPLAGALFAGEILYKDAEIESDVIVPAAISSIIGYSVYSLSLPPDYRFTPLFGRDLQFEVGSTLELIPYALLAIILSFVAVLYIKVFYGTHKIFDRLPIPVMLRPALGALLAGLIGLGIFYGFDGDVRALAVLSTGYGAIQHAVASQTTMAIPLLLAIAFGKIVTTSCTISSGGSGGVFGPSMVIGGSIGSAVGQFFHEYSPDIVHHPQAYTIVGMAGFFAGAAHAPISTIIMVSEMTGNYQLLLPAMWVSTLCFLFCRRWTLYQKQAPSRMESPAHRGDFIVDVLEGIHVSDVFVPGRPVTCVPESMTLDQIVHLLAETHESYFPVVNEQDRVVGIFSARDVRTYLYDETIWNLAIAEDIMTTKIVSVKPNDDLNTALQRFTAVNLDELPVFDAEEPGKLLGMLRRKETIAFYNRQLLRRKQGEVA